MAHVISDKCTKDGVCLSVCPTDSIHPRKDENYDEPTQLFIDPGTCIDCGVCVDECPQKAIAAESESDPKFVESNAAHFK